MAQAKVTSYYTRRKRIDDAQPTKRRKLLSSSSSGITGADKSDRDSASVLDEADLKAGLLAFTKQVLPKVDRSVLLEDTISQCATRTRSTRKPRATQTRGSKRTKKGPLDAHLERVTSTAQTCQSNISHCQDGSPKLSVLPLKLGLQTDFLKISDSESTTQQRSPPSTPTKRPQHSDEAPSRKKRSRIVSSDAVALETDDSGSSSVSQPVRMSRKKVQAGKQSSKATTNGRSAKKSLEASLLEFTKSDVHNKEKISEEGNESSTTLAKASQLTKSPNLTSTSSIQGTSSDASSSSRNGSGLQAFIEQTSRSVASSGVKPPKVNSALSDRIKEAVDESKSETSKTKLTPAQMKERLAKTCKLSDLQARLAKVKECADQAKKPVKDAPVASAKDTASPPVTDVKTEEPSLPAYQKYHALVSTAPPTLSLPFRYKLLEEMFRSTDTVVSMLHNRSEMCSFAKVKKAVQEMCRRTFEQHNLGQIKTVYPTAYFLRQEKVARSKANSYELVLEPNTGSGIGTSAGQESSECVKQPSKTDAKSDAVSKLMRKLTPSMLIARRSIFHNNLVDIVKEHHNEFLSRLNRPLSVPGDKLTRWHPKFPLDQVPDVSSAPLPQPPTVTTYSTAKDVLDKARVMMNPRVAKALEVVAKNSALLKAEKDLKAAAEPKPSVKTEVPKKPEAKSVSGVNQSLLDRIRAKEAKNLTAMMTRSPADQERIAMLERLPELCRILRVFFVSEKKAALPIEAVVQKLCESYPSILSKAQVEKHVGLMVEALPDWLSKVTVRKDHYLKINKTKDMGQVNDRVNQLLRESKQHKGQS